ncbi:MAG: hypothetical protein U0521_04325 [Anaerolineae bacterium]
MRIDGFDVLVNKPRVTAYRAPGGSNAAFASKSPSTSCARSWGWMLSSSGF